MSYVALNVRERKVEGRRAFAASRSNDGLDEFTLDTGP